MIVVATCALHNYICQHNSDEDVDFSNVVKEPPFECTKGYKANIGSSTLRNEYIFSDSIVKRDRECRCYVL